MAGFESLTGWRLVDVDKDLTINFEARYSLFQDPVACCVNVDF